jgi:hypothetical protein
VSIKALNWAFALPIMGGQKAVLLALANHADAEGECYPSIATIALHAGLKERGTRQVMRHLEALGLITTTPTNGRLSTYRLNFELAQTPAVRAPLPRHVVPPYPGTTCPPPSPTLFPNIQPTVGKSHQNDAGPRHVVPPNLSKKDKILNSVLVNSAFLEFWKCYPRKIGKGAAMRSWAKSIKIETPENILAAVARQAWPADPKYIPHPATWLNQHRWADEPDPGLLSVDQRIARIMGIDDPDDPPSHEMRTIQ